MEDRKLDEKETIQTRDKVEFEDEEIFDESEEEEWEESDEEEYEVRDEDIPDDTASS